MTSQAPHQISRAVDPALPDPIVGAGPDVGTAAPGKGRRGNPDEARRNLEPVAPSNLFLQRITMERKILEPITVL